MAFLLRQSVFVIIQRLDYNQGNIKPVWHLPRLWGSWLHSFTFVIDVLCFFLRSLRSATRLGWKTSTI